MERIKLTVHERSAIGSNKIRKLREQDMIPGIVYGKGKPGIPIKVSLKEVHGVKGGHVDENVLMSITIKNGKKKSEKTVIVKEIQKDSIKEDWLHIDFCEISLKEKLKTPVHIEIMGEAEGVTEGGVLDHITHEVEVECLPTDIPEKIEVVVNDMVIGDTVYVKDLEIPEGVTILTEPEEPVVSVTTPRQEEEEAEETEAVEGEGLEGEEGAEPEVIGKGKKEEAEGEEEAAKEEGEAKPREKEEKKQ